MFDQRLRETWIALLLGARHGGAGLCRWPRSRFQTGPDRPPSSNPPTRTAAGAICQGTERRGLLYQFWTFDADHRHAFLLNPGEGDDLAGYRPDFDLARTASGWCGCRRWARVIRRSSCTAGTATNSHPRPKSPLAIWPGIISSPRRHRRGCIGTRRTPIRSTTPLRHWSRGWRKITPGWGSIGPTAATS